MKIVSIKHKGLKLLYEKDNAKLLPPQYAAKIGRILDVLVAAKDIDVFMQIPRGRPHRLKGARKDTYAISVYANWRLTFEYDAKDKAIHILDFEDYH